ncbi:MAG: redoxin domain-containing protein [Phycisphaerales bacterium]|nr:MAG: redoxin domain-containing protein [Phycisphaerales bacterium]
MKRQVVSFLVVIMTLAPALTAFGQSEERRPGRATRQGQQPTQDLSKEDFNGIRERWRNMSEEEREKFRAQMRQRFESMRRGTAADRQLRDVEGQIATLKAQYEGLIGELKAVRELATKEKANETAKRLATLISQQEKQLQEKLQELEQRRQRLQRSVGRSESRQRIEQLGKKAPEFKLESFDGKTISLSDYKDKIVVLEWLNFECPFSRHHYAKVNTMVDLARKYKGQNVVWFAVNSTSHVSPGANKDFSKRHKLQYPILDDRSGKIGKAYGAKTTPHMYIIKDGMIVYDGAIDDNAQLTKPKNSVTNYVDKALTELTTGRAVSTPNTKPYGCTVKYAP